MHLFVFFYQGSCYVGGKSEQMNLKSFGEDGERLCCPDIDLEIVPPLRRQNREESQLRRVSFVLFLRCGYEPAS